MILSLIKLVVEDIGYVYLRGQGVSESEARRRVKQGMQLFDTGRKVHKAIKGELPFGDGIGQLEDLMTKKLYEYIKKHA
jgi:hypothetical protein